MGLSLSLLSVNAGGGDGVIVVVWSIWSGCGHVVNAGGGQVVIVVVVHQCWRWQWSGGGHMINAGGGELVIVIVIC